MRIAVDATCWSHRRGFGRSVRALMRALARLDRANHYVLFLDSEESGEPIPDEFEVRVLQAASPTVQAASAQGRRSVADLWRMSRALSASEFDILFFPAIYSFVPTFGRARKIVMVHDVIADTYPHLTVPRLSARLFWTIKTALGRLQADALITVSEYAREGICKRFHLRPNRVLVVGEAAEPVFRKLEAPLPGPKLESTGITAAMCASRRLAVYLGGFSPHKNLEALVSAFARIARRPEFEDVLLVMAGDTSGDAFHSYFGIIAAQVESLGLGGRVVFTGFLDDEDLAVLLNLASVLTLPSLMEGFGLPAVEAAACGCPVIATTASPLPELLGPAGIFIDPTEDRIAPALEEVLASEDLRRRMSVGGLEASRRLTWDESAEQMMEVIRRVAA